MRGLLFALAALLAGCGSAPLTTTLERDTIQGFDMSGRFSLRVDAGEQPAQSASGRLETVLADVAGLQQFRRSDSRSANPTSQGLSLRGIGGNASSRALLLLDGVPQADPFGGWVAFPAYATNRLGRVRVMRGGGSGYLGAGALAGTVELESAAPDQQGPFEGAAFRGSRGSVDVVGAATLERGPGFATVSAAYARGDGFTPIVRENRGPVDRPAPYEQVSGAVRGVVEIAPVRRSAPCVPRRRCCSSM